MTQPLSEFIKDYLTTALWASTDISSKGESLDKTKGLNDIAFDTTVKAIEDCHNFYYQCKGYGFILNSDAGHDFFLTRTGHGAGFWDGKYTKALGDELTKLAKDFGHVDFYIGDDGKVYSTP